MKTVRFRNKTYSPSKIICVGRNYHRHIKELNNKDPEEIVLFIKPNSSLSEELIKPQKRCRYEGEISFIFEKGEIAGIGFGIDLTLVDEQERLKTKGLPWEKAKGFDNSAVFSEFVEIKPEEIQKVRMELFINGELRQSGDVSNMIYKPQQIVKEIKKYFSLYDGDILMCGTPEGVGQFEKGDIFEGKIYINDGLAVQEKWTVR
ncbi:2-keto-4-pentenoate hydratase/2-oxohepta-3-ene-1,7-dioic acid hydratase (catechol pathway) [Persephonella hydrogeniphila]|uniref:2-keto-4-pentenoate hydratase/2-oxohepta-3-ene-1,7-dioic acid hydratase (Catechol pathway) n=1 Tax=Persephonella hydrogeniphila TaxID=198703 RepID=A0A285N219_9AQUI|nr:fumarylacetoacetate hydrolase family protein [Persephonella hydrogeniphila]SNZ03525.1 2-keto-4-pentenoate hydratase/2-oxohepta-3-ene-1,7-dioic acid hydratase (catechol pathway) [Persephonella hydrogeniphila]